MPVAHRAIVTGSRTVLITGPNSLLSAVEIATLEPINTRSVLRRKAERRLNTRGPLRLKRSMKRPVLTLCSRETKQALWRPADSQLL